jgi:hypothetical protein
MQSNMGYEELVYVLITSLTSYNVECLKGEFNSAQFNSIPLAFPKVNQVLAIFSTHFPFL